MTGSWSEYNISCIYEFSSNISWTVKFFALEQVYITAEIQVDLFTGFELHRVFGVLKGAYYNYRRYAGLFQKNQANTVRFMSDNSGAIERGLFAITELVFKANFNFCTHRG